MSHYVNVKSVCGNSSTAIDMYDWELNRDGVICCDNCKSIMICRNAWNELYKEKN